MLLKVLTCTVFSLLCPLFAESSSLLITLLKRMLLLQRVLTRSIDPPLAPLLAPRQLSQEQRALLLSLEEVTRYLGLATKKGASGFFVKPLASHSIFGVRALLASCLAGAFSLICGSAWGHGP